MKNKTLIELVKYARGDRSLREYAKDSVVNVSILSRIENGEYKPGRKVLEKLTAPNAKPQGGVTYQNLVEAAFDDAQYRKGMAAGMAVAGMTPAAMAGLPGITTALAALASGLAATKAQTLLQARENTEGKVKQQELENVASARYSALNEEIQRFAATATGILYGTLTEKGIRFRPGSKEETDMVLYDTDTLIFIDGEDIDTWMMSFIALSDEDRGLDKLVKRSAISMFERLLFTTPDPRRKVSIVVNNDVLYDYMVAYKGKNSYRGNLSIIEVDAKKVRVIREYYIAYYDLNMQDEKMKIKKTQI